MSSLVSDRTKHQHATYVCNACMHPFATQQAHDNHLEYCLKHPAQMTVCPNAEDEDKCTMKFRAHRKQFRLPFYIVADFESFLEPTDDSEFDRGMKVINNHEVSGFACHRVTDIKEYKTAPTVYSGPNPVSVFYDHIMKESREISKILDVEVPMPQLT